MLFQFLMNKKLQKLWLAFATLISNVAIKLFNKFTSAPHYNVALFKTMSCFGPKIVILNTVRL